VIVSALQDRLTWVGFAQWIAFFPVIVCCQYLLVPRAGLVLTGIVLIALLATVGSLLLFLPLYLIDDLPLPAQPRLGFYGCAAMLGGFASIPIRQFLTRRFERKNQGSEFRS